MTTGTARASLWHPGDGNYSATQLATGQPFQPALRRPSRKCSLSAKLTAIGMVASIMTTMMAALSAMIPRAQHFATATGRPLETKILLQMPTWFYFM